MEREHWACLYAGVGVTGAALCLAHGETIGVLVFGAILIGALFVARSCDVRRAAARTAFDVE